MTAMLCLFLVFGSTVAEFSCPNGQTSCLTDACGGCPVGYTCNLEGKFCYSNGPSPCGPGSLPCGSKCCPSGYQCGPTGDLCVLSNQSPCFNGAAPCNFACCNDGYQCDPTGKFCLESPCGPGFLPCGSKCCPNGYQCGPTGDLCILSNQTSTDACGGCPVGYTCNPEGKFCYSNGPVGDIYPDDKTNCSNDRTPCGNGACCEHGLFCTPTGECEHPHCTVGAVACYGKCCEQGYHCGPNGDECERNSPYTCPNGAIRCGDICCEDGYMCDPRSGYRCYTGLMGL